MAYLYLENGADFGPLYADRNDIAYQVVPKSNPAIHLIEKTTSGVAQTNVKGFYHVPAGISLPDDIAVLIEWYVGANLFPTINEPVDPNWPIPSTGAGQYRFRPRVIDDQLDPQSVQNAVVTIQNAGGVIVAWAYTDVNGYVDSFNLFDGLYTVLVTGPTSEYGSLPPQPLIIAGANELDTVYTLSMQSASAPPSPGLSTIVFDTVELIGVPLEGCLCEAELVDINVAVVSPALISRQKAAVVTNLSGHGELTVIRGGAISKGNKHVRFKVTAPDGTLMSVKTAVVPDTTPVPYTALL